ncbi:MAG TPA: (S)-ureidoglycine aminohydrolase [Acidobacteriaceae bacterium]|nr:(S)-ureidoglycine aminohydrolase [Acidobacteriaceae bacterium]
MSNGVPHLGQTRSRRRKSYLLHTPDTFIRTQIPGTTKAAVIVHVSPALGAAFTQYTVEFEAGGVLGAALGQRFIYVLDGAVAVDAGTHKHALGKGGFAYIPQGVEQRVSAIEKARAAVIEQPYREVKGIPAPEFLVGHENDATSQALMGDSSLQVRSLLPDTMAFDFAVNTMTYQPGAALSMVEIHVMEHGLLMLEGGGIYRLDDDWHPVTAGDFIWMAPYCPQWFGAIGRSPAKYLIYKDWNRHPLR